MNRTEDALDFEGTTFPMVLAFSSAYIEVACFIGLLGLFTSFVTGNIILVGVELVQPSPEIITKILVLVLFVIACALWSWAFRNVPRPSSRAIRTALGTELILLLLAMTLAWLLGPLAAIDAPATFAVAAPVVLASSLQLITMRHQIIAHPHTTVMTGNIGHLTIAITSLLFTQSARDRAEKVAHKGRAARHQAATIAGFVIGALCGGVAFAQIGFFSLVVPTLIFLVYAMFGRISAVR